MIASKRNSSNILDEPVPKINAPTLKPKQFVTRNKVESLKSMAGSISNQIFKNLNQFADWILSYVPQPIESTVSTQLKNLKDKINSIFDEIRGKNEKEEGEDAEKEEGKDKLKNLMRKLR